LYGGGVESYTAKQLGKSGMPSPLQLSTFDFVSGVAFDSSGNLWAVVVPDLAEVVEFTPAQLKSLNANPSPTPAATITSTSTFTTMFTSLSGCTFDNQGNLWVVDHYHGSIDELSQAQLAAGSANVTPPVVITSPALDGPDFIAFDKDGNAWVSVNINSTIVKYSASQLTSSGTKSPEVVLSDDGSGSLSGPGQLAFDRNGDLWVPSFFTHTVLEYAKSQLTSSGNPSPKVKLRSAALMGPWGMVFDKSDNLVVMNYSDGSIVKFTAPQLKESGARKPKIVVTGPSVTFQITFGPKS
jgi:sugar lactone lactonase YvrE